MTSRLLTTDLAALAADVTPDTIRQWARRGHLRNYGDGHRALWDLAELNKRISHRDTPTPRERRCA